MSNLRNYNDLSASEQLEVLTKIKNLLVATLLDEVHAGNVSRDRLSDADKRLIATTAPVAVNWNETPTADGELDASAVVADVEALLA